MTQVVKIYGLENRSSRRLISSVKRVNIDKICKTFSEVLFFVGYTVKNLVYIKGSD